MSHDPEVWIRQMAAQTGIPEAELRAAFLAPRVTLPAPACPPWCDRGHGWEWAGPLSWSALHSCDLGTVREVTVSVVAEESVTLGDLPVVTAPAVRLYGEPAHPFTAGQVARLAALLTAAGSLLATIGGQR